MNHVENKVVIITGASSGIGEATAKRLALQKAKVVLASRREDRLKKLAEEIQSLGEVASYQVTDVTKVTDLEALVEFTLEKYGTIDVLFNNAGIMPVSPLRNRQIDEWNAMIDINIRGVLNGIYAVLPTMRAQKAGHIINTSSIAGLLVVPNSSVYSASKVAVKTITEGLRMEEASTNIRTTVIYPGTIDTELAQTISDEKIKSDFDSFKQLAIAPSAIANAVAYAIDQPDDVSINEIVVRPTAQEL